MLGWRRQRAAEGASRAWPGHPAGAATAQSLLLAPQQCWPAHAWQPVHCSKAACSCSWAPVDATPDVRRLQPLHPASPQARRRSGTRRRRRSQRTNWRCCRCTCTAHQPRRAGAREPAAACSPPRARRARAALPAWSCRPLPRCRLLPAAASRCPSRYPSWWSKRLQLQRCRQLSRRLQLQLAVASWLCARSRQQR